MSFGSFITQFKISIFNQNGRLCWGLKNDTCFDATSVTSTPCGCPLATLQTIKNHKQKVKSDRVVWLRPKYTYKSELDSTGPFWHGRFGTNAQTPTCFGAKTFWRRYIWAPRRFDMKNLNTFIFTGLWISSKLLGKPKWDFSYTLFESIF